MKTQKETLELYKTALKVMKNNNRPCDVIENKIEFSREAIKDINTISNKAVEFLHFCTESMTDIPDHYRE